MANIIQQFLSKIGLVKEQFPTIQSVGKRTYQEMQLEFEAKQQREVDSFKKHLEQDVTAYLHIEKSNMESVYLTVTNKSSYIAVFQQIIGDVNSLRNELEQYCDTEQTIPEDMRKPIIHLAKNIEMFIKRLELGRQLNDANFVRSSDYREAAREKLTDLIRSFFITKCMQPINEGLRIKEKQKYYLEIGEIFNAFLKKQGIYTMQFSTLDKIDFELLIPESKKNTTEETLNGLIADIYVLPYFFNDPNYQGHALISEGVCVAYSMQ